MKILFLLSCLEPAGSETYCVSLAEAWRGRHEVFWISDRLHYGQSYTSLPIHQKAFPQGVINTWRVAQFVRRHKMDLIHSHSRRSHWVAAQAAWLAGAAHVTTIHQPPPVHLFSRLFPCFGDATLAIDEAVVDHVTQRFHVNPGRVHLVRNGINLDRFKNPCQEAPSPGLVPGEGGLPAKASMAGGEGTSPAAKRVLLLGRLTGGRWQAFEFFIDVLERMARSLPPAVFQVAGQVPHERAAAFNKRLRDANAILAPSRVESVGFVQDLPALLESVDGVIAGGRSAIESLAMAKPVIMMGEGGVLGMCGPETWAQAMRTNFGDHLAPKAFFPAPLELALREMLLEPERANDMGRWGREQVEKYYDVRKTAKEIEQVYSQLISCL